MAVGAVEDDEVVTVYGNGFVVALVVLW